MRLPYVRTIRPLGKFLRLIERLVPPKTGLVVIDAYPNFDDSVRALAPALAARQLRVVVVVSAEGLRRRPEWLPCEVVVRKKRSAAGSWLAFRAEIVFHTHGSYCASGGIRGRLSVGLWHGMPLKKIGIAIGTAPPKADLTLATSRPFAEILALSFGMKPEHVMTLGLPRNDVLVHGEERDRRAVSTLIGARDFVVYLPTYRKSEEGERHLDGDPRFLNDADVALIASEAARQGLSIVVKPHPMDSRAESLRWQNFANCVLLDDDSLIGNDTTLYGLLSQSCGLLSDYSGVVVDYLVTGRPICLFVPDLDDYSCTRGLNFSTDELSQLGTVATTGKIVADWIQTVRLADSRAELPPMFYSAPQEGATDRLLRIVLGSNTP